MGGNVHIMGILNVTPDSFYDGGKYNGIDMAVSHAERMAEDGADIIDIGGESTRPGSCPVSEKEEIRRILPVIRRLVKTLQIPISVDTYKAATAKRVLDEGVSIVNDIGGLRFDPGMADVVKEYNVQVVMMHIVGRPKDMQQNPQYKSLMLDIKQYFYDGIELAVGAGVDAEKIIIDPGIGFGKTTDDNLTILRSLSQLGCFGKPILVGVSRKSFIGNVLHLTTEERLEGSLAAAAVAVINGANIIRTHDVRETLRAVRMAEAIKGVNKQENDLPCRKS